MKEIHVIGERPAIPEDWIICNAPRPLTGDETWEGEFQHGIFYAALNPHDFFFKISLARNQTLDAWMVLYYSEAEARACLKAFYPRYEDKIDDLPFEIMADSFHERMNR